MRKFYLLTFAILYLFAGVSKAQIGKIIGTWEFKYQIINGDTCNTKNKSQITFSSNSTFLEMDDGYKSIGKFSLKGDTIMYYDCSEKSIIKNGIIANHSYAFHFSENGMLIQEEPFCSEIVGTTYYKKK
jgi:hypothetical protein